MTKFLLTIAALAGSAGAFAPASSVKSTVSLNEFANGYVGGEGPEPIPFSSQGSSVNWDPCGFAEVGVCQSSLRRRFPLYF
jgi:hypothetical protein